MMMSVTTCTKSQAALLTISINTGLTNTPKKLPNAASNTAAASSPPTNFLNTMPMFTLTLSVEVIVIPSAKLRGKALTCNMNREKPYTTAEQTTKSNICT